MTGKKTPRGRVTYHGSVPATDPRYSSGWNFLSGKNLSPPSLTPSNAAGESAQVKPPETPPVE